MIPFKNVWSRSCWSNLTSIAEDGQSKKSWKSHIIYEIPFIFFSNLYFVTSVLTQMNLSTFAYIFSRKYSKIFHSFLQLFFLYKINDFTVNRNHEIKASNLCVGLNWNSRFSFEFLIIERKYRKNEPLTVI